MASATVYSAVRAWLAASWATTPIAYENETFRPDEPPAEWVLLEVYGDSYDQMSIGSGSPSTERWVEQGTVLLHVMAPVGSGSVLARTYAEQLATLLRGLILPGDIRFQSMSIGLGESDETGNYWRITLRAEWLRG